ELDLWATAKPFLEKWMREQVGLRGLLRTVRKEAPYWATMLPQMPRLLHRALAGDRIEHLEQRLAELVAQQRRRTRILPTAGASLPPALAWAGFLPLFYPRIPPRHADRVRRRLPPRHDRDRPVGRAAGEELEGLRRRRPQPASVHEHGHGVRHLVR